MVTSEDIKNSTIATTGQIVAGLRPVFDCDNGNVLITATCWYLQWVLDGEWQQCQLEAEDFLGAVLEVATAMQEACND